MIFPRRPLSAAICAMFVPVWLGSANVAKAAQTGLLQCNVAPAVGFVITSSKSLSCEFRRNNGDIEYYVGSINSFGVAIGATGPGRLVWGVLAATPYLNPFALAGQYAGATANLSFGPGLGANALVGGSGNSVALQPLSVNAQTGVDLTAGISSLTLQAVPPPPEPVVPYYHHRHHHY
jgi:hypothetical protein